MAAHEPAKPEAQANYVCRSWDGRQFYQHSRKINAPISPGSVHLQQPTDAKEYRLWPRRPLVRR